MQTIQTSILLVDWLAAKTDHNSLARLIISIDPVTHHKVLEVYSEDGKGNGDLQLICSLD